MTGRIYPSESLILHTSQGSARSAEHGEFELNTNLDGSPLIRSEKTGKYWSIGWQELLGMAVDAGITRQGGE